MSYVCHLNTSIYNPLPTYTTTTSTTIGKANQTVSFGTAPAIAVDGTGTVSATATSSLAVSFSSTTPNVCSVSGSTVTAITAGTCTIAVNQAGNANYNAAAQVSQSITIGTGNLSLPLLLEQGWNLLGNSLSQPIGVTTMLGEAPAESGEFSPGDGFPGFHCIPSRLLLL